MRTSTRRASIAQTVNRLQFQESPTRLFKNLSIRQRLYGAVALLTLVFAVAATVSVHLLQGVVYLSVSTGERRVPQLMQMAQLELNVTRLSLQLRHAMLSRTPEELEATVNEIVARRKQIEEILVQYEKGLYTPAGRERFKGLPPVVANFWQVGEANLRLIQEGRREEAFAFLVERTVPARNALLTQLSETVDYQRETLAKDLVNIQTDVSASAYVIVGMLVGSLAVLVLLSAHIGRLLQQRIGVATAVAQQVRRGELAGRVVDDRRDEVSPLLAALSEMQQGLAAVVTRVRSNAEMVARASATIHQANHDLSGRTEQQAAALQQTAATMEQLGGTARSNADGARQANDVAQAASKVASTGGDVVNQVVVTMRGISDSSRRIGDIIGVIDGIAFQTNILALNAAVEAARAGEQGRGFAVVASEVRNLAQRSAGAAKEIKALIQRSVEQVDVGTGLVDQAGKTMGEVVTSIRQVSDLVAQISAASVQQSSGVQQVGDAVTQMDRDTQKSAAVVEQYTAAAEDLKRQAQELMQAVSVFRTSTS